MADADTDSGWKTIAPQSAPDDYHIEVEKSLVDQPLRTLKRDDLFGVFDNYGDFRGEEHGAHGLYFHDTRFLSRLEFRLGGKPPLLLDSVVLDDNSALIVDTSNADLHVSAAPAGAAPVGMELPRETLFASRLKFLWEDAAYERILIRRFGGPGLTIPADLRFDADFADLFEVRGDIRPKRGTLSAAVVDPATVRFSYVGLDEIARTTTIQFEPAPDELRPLGARWLVDLTERDRATILTRVHCAIGDAPAADPPSPIAAYRGLRRSGRKRTAALRQVETSNEMFDSVLGRSAADLEMLITKTPHGLYPYAGVPWYSTIFGRDGLITAIELLWIAPAIARDVLLVLARTQATEVDEAADAQPGKILHEMRGGEMAILGEVPFRRYYGTVDATPLFVMLAGLYFRRTGDIETIRSIWPNIQAAMGWITDWGDPDGDGFVEYHRMTDRGLANQGWKDSHDSIFHADGRGAEGPIALCEVQAYVFAAHEAAALLADALGEPGADAHAAKAEAIRAAFEDRFWIEEMGCYALALDGRKDPCRVLSSNAGHALFAGIAAPDRAARVAKLLTGSRFFTGWGIRTIAAGEARYNPMSYHNGSVWPHDNALIAMGLARYGHKAEAARVLHGLFEAATYDELHRLPELFCGFPRRRKRGPTGYPVACSPQAWAAAAPFALLGAAIGVDLDHAAGALAVDRPFFPDFLDSVRLPELRLGSSAMTLAFHRAGQDIAAQVVARSGPARLVVSK